MVMVAALFARVIDNDTRNNEFGQRAARPAKDWVQRRALSTSILDTSSDCMLFHEPDIVGNTNPAVAMELLPTVSLGLR